MTKYNHAEFNLTHTRAEIDAEERRLIDEAVAAGRVEKVPTGRMATHTEFVWQGDADHHGIGKLVPKEPMTRAEALAKFKSQNVGRRFTQADPRIVHRRAEVLRLTREGYAAPVIAECLGVNAPTVKRDREHWRKKGELPKLSSGSNGKSVEAIGERRERVLALLIEGKTSQEIADELGETKPSIMSDRLALRVAGRIGKAP